MLLQEQYKRDGVNSDIQNEFWSYGEYELVGHGKQTNDSCGKFKKLMGCVKTELHNLVTLDGHCYKDKVFVKKIYHSCDKPFCPACYKFGWATREAHRIERRIKEGQKRFGLAEHVVVSIPDSDYGFTLEAMRRKVVKILWNRGVIGGCLIFHGFRYRNRRFSRRTGSPMGWFWSPHFHVIGFIGGSGYGRCRSCSFNPRVVHNWDKCKTCKGFEGVTRRCYEKEGGRAGSGYIVKVLAKRKTIGGTAWYQLHHASVRRSKKSHVVTWFGCMSYRKLKLTNGDGVGINFSKCPICGSELVRLHYLGDFSKLDVSRRGDILDLYDEDGNPLWEISTYKGG